jgi:hypothetical protein
MRRRFFNFVAGLSLLLGVGVCVLWVRSYWVCSTLRATGEVSSCRGHIEAVWVNTWSCPAAAVDASGNPTVPLVLEQSRPPGFVEEDSGPLMIEPNWFGFGYRWNSYSNVQNDEYFKTDLWVYVVPYWLVFVVVTGPAVLCLATALRARRARLRLVTGCCIACGYDLRASAGRCPECGTVVASTTTPDN